MKPHTNRVRAWQHPPFALSREGRQRKAHFSPTTGITCSLHSLSATIPMFFAIPVFFFAVRIPIATVTATCLSPRNRGGIGGHTHTHTLSLAQSFQPCDREGLSRSPHPSLRPQPRHPATGEAPRVAHSAWSSAPHTHPSIHYLAASSHTYWCIRLRSREATPQYIHPYFALHSPIPPPSPPIPTHPPVLNDGLDQNATGAKVGVPHQPLLRCASPHWRVLSSCAAALAMPQIAQGFCCFSLLPPLPSFFFLPPLDSSSYSSQCIHVVSVFLVPKQSTTKKNNLSVYSARKHRSFAKPERGVAFARAAICSGVRLHLL
eukprot:Rhum_TRINITY_DN14606_c16_g1::Rhum_TRINITY_DN14606_c16_g1_i1::g.104182::m.104182